MSLGADVRVEPDDSITIRFTGELDLAQVVRLTQLLAGILRQSPRVRLDLARVTFMDCAALGVLVRAGRQAQAAGGWLRISACHPIVRRLLRLTELQETFGLDR